MRLKSSNIKKIVRKSRGSISPNLSVFIGQKSVLRRYSIQTVKDGIHIQVYNSNNENINHFSQLLSVKIKKISGSISGKVKKIVAQAK